MGKEESEAAARAMFAEFSVAIRGTGPGDFRGNDPVTWDRLPATARAAWMRAAEAGLKAAHGVRLRAAVAAGKTL